jgi:hypothetical protein
VKADFVVAFWMVHEVPEVGKFLQDVKWIMNPEANFLIAEPLSHVYEGEF